jgi:hypothetical protein
MYIQQPMAYGQGMYGAYGPPANAVGAPYAQSGYAMRPAYAAGAAPSPYGPGYVDAGNGQPAIVFGGAYEGVGGPGAGYRAAYQQPTYQMQQPGYPQTYGVAGQAQVLQPQPQGYATAAQPPPPYNQPYAAQVQQPSAYAQPPQAAPQYAAAPNQALQQAPQYAPASQPSPQPAYQQNLQYPAGTQAPGQNVTQGSAQYPPASQPSPQPQGTQISQPPGQAVYQQATQYSVGSQPSPQAGQNTQYNPSPQPSPSPQPQYPALSQPSSTQPPPQATYSQAPITVDRTQFFAAARSSDPRAGFAALGIPTVAAVGSMAQGPQQNQFPAYLSPSDIVVQFEPISKSVDTHHHAMKALSHSSHSVSELSAIIGTYLAAKHSGDNYSFGVSASRPEIRQYYHVMDKLEKLSADYVGKHNSSLGAWKTSLGPHRRQVFAELYNRNELVRAFCQEMQGGPLALPELESYSLGKRLTSFNFARSAIRPSNLRAELSVLAQVRTVILVDDSYSMTEPGHQSWGFGLMRGGVETRWMQTRNLLAGIAPLVAAENPHGVDLHFLNRIPFYAGLLTTQAIQSAFDSDRPNNGTPTGARVNDILDAYVSTLRYYRALKPLNLIVITDGEAQDEDILHKSIEHHVTELVHRGFPAHQFGIEFVQVGDCEHATRHLEKLEKEVSRHHHRFQRDVVGVTPASRINSMDPEAMLAIAVSGIDARMNGYMRSRGVNV